VLEDDETGDFVYADLDDNGNLIPTNDWVGKNHDGNGSDETSSFANRRRQWKKNLKSRLENVDCQHFLCKDNDDGFGENDNRRHPLQDLLLGNGFDQSSNTSSPNYYMIGHKTNDDDDLNVRRRGLAVNQPRVLKNLVVMMKFEDHTTRPLPTQKEMDVLMNGSEETCKSSEYFHICGPSGSVRSFYYTMTHQQLIIDSYVADWVTVPYTEKKAADGASGYVCQSWLCNKKVDCSFAHLFFFFVLNRLLFSRTSTIIHAVLKKALSNVNTQFKNNPSVSFKDFDSDRDGHIDAITFIHSVRSILLYWINGRTYLS
jgi:hypothetical protein